MYERRYNVGDVHRKGDPQGNVRVLFDHERPDALPYFVRDDRTGLWSWEWKASDQSTATGDEFSFRNDFDRNMTVHAIAPFQSGDYVSGLGANTGKEYVGTYADEDPRDPGRSIVRPSSDWWDQRWVWTETLVHRTPRPLHVIAVDETHLFMTNANDPAPEAARTVRARVLREAERITATDRNSSYGEPEDNFARIAAFWNVFLQDKLKPGVEISAGDTAALVILIKLAREMNAPKEDNKIDIAGYAACWAEVDAKKEQSE